MTKISILGRFFLLSGLCCWAHLPAIGDDLEGSTDTTASDPAGAPDGPSDEPAAGPAGRAASLRIFHLQHADAAAMEEHLKKIYPGQIASIAADRRTNALIIRATTEMLDEAEAILQKLDEPTAQKPV